MAQKPDEKAGNGNEVTNGEGTAQQQTLNILAQYVKDLSFESPGAPLSLRPRDKAPGISINVNVNANPIAENDFDVVLTLSAKAGEGKEVLFNAELVYGGVFRLVGFPRNTCCRCCWCDCPRLLFPFARQIIAEARAIALPASVDQSHRFCADVPAAHGGRSRPRPKSAELRVSR